MIKDTQTLKFSVHKKYLLELITKIIFEDIQSRVDDRTVSCCGYSRDWCSANMAPKAWSLIFSEVMKNQWVTTKGLQTSLEQADISVHKCTNRNHWTGRGSMAGHDGGIRCSQQNYCPECQKALKICSAIRTVFYGLMKQTELSERNTEHFVWAKKGIAYKHQNIIPVVK